MNTNTLRETFRELEESSPTLDPGRVIAGARRRGARRLALGAGAAALGTAAAIVAGFALAGSLGDTSGDPFAGQPTPQPPVQSSDGPVRLSPAPVIRTAPPAPRTVRVPGPRSRIADGAWVKVSAQQWFSISGRDWRLMDRPGPGNGSSDVVGAKELAQGWQLTMPYGRRNDWSSFALLRGDIRRVVFTAETSAGWGRHEARVFRLDSMPGWVMAHAAYRVQGEPDGHDWLTVRATLDAYDGSGRHVLHCGPPPYAIAKGAPSRPVCTTG